MAADDTTGGAVPPDAEARAGGPHGNKGWDAAEAALEMADLLDRLPKRAGEKADEWERSLR